ncbi:MAG: extracellular solute-binding protein [Candidatus Fimimonas sp.]
MKKSSRILALVLSVVMVIGMFALVACTPEENPDNNNDTNAKTVIKNVSMWVSEAKGVAELTLDQVKAYNAREDAKYTIDIATLKIEGVSESESATKMIADVETGADVFCFSQDQTARLVNAGALAQPGVKATETIESENDAAAVAAATIGGRVMAYPLTSDNGYFMYYDKRVITDESHLDDLAALVADCEAAGKNFAMETETSAWYLASFFFATGCHSNWNIDENGKPLSIDDTFNSDEGVIALRGMQQLVKSPNYISSSGAAEFSAATPAAILVSGTWAYTDVVDILGEGNVGCTDLPSFTVDRRSYHMGSFSGNKLMGVKPTKDATRAAALQDLALYLTNETCQLQRFESVKWGPSNKNAQQNEGVKANIALSALAKQSAYATPQGQIDGSWWDIAKVIGTGAKEAALDDEVALKAVLDKYDADITAVINKDDSDANRWTVIGAINGDSWTKDIDMKEKPAGTWTTSVLYLTKDTEFKVRKGQKWGEDTGATVADSEYVITLEGGNAQITTTGLYLIQFDSTAKEIKAIPVTLGIVGTINNWGTTEDTALTLVEDVTDVIVAYNAIVELPAAAEIKVRPNNSWDFGDFGGEEGGNIVIETAGNYEVKLALTEEYVWVLTVTLIP